MNHIFMICGGIGGTPLLAGAHAIVVSNHGGRILDHTPGTTDLLPKIAEEMKGKLEIIVDEGNRTGAT